jgi:hypothetical protein
VVSPGGDAAAERSGTTRRRTDFNAAERRLSEVLRQRLLELLEGRRDRLELLRTYPKEPGRLGIIATPSGLPRQQLRLPVAERLARDVLDFVRGDAAAPGPLAQSLTPDGGVVERQTLPTRYRHILIERTDRYRGDDPEPVETAWLLRRVERRRAPPTVEGLLCAASLALELVRAVG